MAISPAMLGRKLPNIYSVARTDACSSSIANGSSYMNSFLCDFPVELIFKEANCRSPPLMDWIFLLLKWSSVRLICGWQFARDCTSFKVRVENSSLEEGKRLHPARTRSHVFNFSIDLPPSKISPFCSVIKPARVFSNVLFPAVWCLDNGNFAFE